VTTSYTHVGGAAIIGWSGCAKKITEDVRKYAGEQGMSENEALKRGMEAKSREFVEKGAEVYAKVASSDSHEPG
jgi:hypothetical protein